MTPYEFEITALKELLKVIKTQMESGEFDGVKRQVVIRLIDDALKGDLGGDVSSELSRLRKFEQQKLI